MNIGTACCHSPDCADRECEGRPTTDLLAQCAASDQMSAAQMVAHERAGELPREDQDEPLTDPAYMLTLAAVWGVVAVAVIVGTIGWLAYFVWPVLAASINR